MSHWVSGIEAHYLQSTRAWPRKRSGVITRPHRWLPWWRHNHFANSLLSQDMRVSKAVHTQSSRLHASILVLWSFCFPRTLFRKWCAFFFLECARLSYQLFFISFHFHPPLRTTDKYPAEEKFPMGSLKQSTTPNGVKGEKKWGIAGIHDLNVTCFIALKIRVVEYRLLLPPDPRAYKNLMIPEHKAMPGFRRLYHFFPELGHWHPPTLFLCVVVLSCKRI